MEMHPSFFPLWQDITSKKDYTGLEFENRINAFFSNNDFHLVYEDEEFGKNKYIVGKSGVSHEIDLVAFEVKTKELIIGECKTSKKIKTNDVINFIFKCDDIMEILIKKYHPLVITKCFFSLYPFPLDGYRLCWFSGVIPFELSVESVPIFIQHQVYRAYINKIITNPYCESHDRIFLDDAYNEILNNVNNKLNSINFYEEYDWKQDRIMKNDFTNKLNAYYDIVYKINQVQRYQQPIYEILIYEILSGKIRTRQYYIKRTRYFLHKIHERIDRINEYVIIKKILNQKHSINTVKNIMPKEYLYTKIVYGILNEVHNYDDYKKLLIKHSIKSSIFNIFHYRLITPAFFLLPEEQLKQFLTIIKQFSNISVLNYNICRHIIKSILRKDIINSVEFYNYLERINRIVNFPWEINEYDIVKYSKSPEVDHLNKMIPFFASSRYLADLILNDEILDLDTYNQYKEYLVNIFWLDADPDYLSVLYSSPETTPVSDFFTSHNIDVIETRHIFIPEYSTISSFLRDTVDAIKNDTSRDERLCDYCGLDVTEHIRFVAGKSYNLCDNCYNLIFSLE